MSGLTKEQLERAVDISLKAVIDEVTTIDDYLKFDVNDSVSLGIPILEKDKNGNPRYHWYSDIRGDEMDETAAEIMRRVIRPVLEDFINQQGKS
jgi:hypothetical protein